MKPEREQSRHDCCVPYVAVRYGPAGYQSRSWGNQVIPMHGSRLDADACYHNRGGWRGGIVR